MLKRKKKSTPAAAPPPSAPPVAAQPRDGVTDQGAPYLRLSDVEVIVLSDGPKPFHVTVENKPYTHVADDGDGRWIYRINS